MKLRVKVTGITQETAGIRSFELAPLSIPALPAFTAGSHTVVELPNGLQRAYSLVNHPIDGCGTYRIAVLNDPSSRGGSKYMHEGISLGDELTISAPENKFPLHHAAKHHILLAGGIGVTPMLSMLREIEQHQGSAELHYCTRSLEVTAFREELPKLGSQGSIEFHHDNGDPKQGLDIRGLLHEPGSGVHVYYCGPNGFMRACEEATAHWPREQVHFERFGAGESLIHSSDQAFNVKINSTGEIFEIPSDKSIAEILRASGRKINTMCEEGICGTCATGVVEGIPDHRDQVLDDDEKAGGDVMMICCSRSKTPLLILDL